MPQVQSSNVPAPLPTVDALRRLVVVRLPGDDGADFEILHASSVQDKERLQAAANLHHLGSVKLDMPLATFNRLKMAALLVDLADHPEVQRRMQRWPDEPLLVVERPEAPAQPRLRLRRAVYR